MLKRLSTWWNEGSSSMKLEKEQLQAFNRELQDKLSLSDGDTARLSIMYQKHLDAKDVFALELKEQVKKLIATNVVMSDVLREIKNISPPDADGLRELIDETLREHSYEANYEYHVFYAHIWGGRAKCHSAGVFDNRIDAEKERADSQDEMYEAWIEKRKKA